MKNKFLTKNLLTIITIIILTSFIALPVKVNATDEELSNTLETTEKPIEILGYLGEETKTSRSQSDPGDPGNIVNQIMNNTFYIKNAYSGRYLEVYHGSAADGINVQQYAFNGGNNQRWYIKYNNDGTFTFFPIMNMNYALDVYGASSDNTANIDIWSYHGGDSQKFKIGYTTNSVYAIVSKVSNYEKAVVVHANGCSDEDNVNQYTYSGNWNEVWILEPVSKNEELGVKYAIDNYNQSVFAYPRCEQDCTNFVSQCLLAGGHHYEGDWKIYRKNGFYKDTELSHDFQVEYSWDVSIPGPWLGAQPFREFWLDKASEAYMCKGSAIVEDPSRVWNINMYEGCVIQIADYDTQLGDSTHSMYVTGYTKDRSYDTYAVTYHSYDTINENLVDICRRNPNSYYLFYVL